MTRQLTKAQDESDLWRRKYEIDGVAKVYIINIGFFFISILYFLFKAEELEMSKLKMQARLSESESTIQQLNAKLSQIEKAKAKSQAEFGNLSFQIVYSNSIIILF